MRAADTNVLIRLLVRDDERQCKAAESFVQGGAWISNVVLTETAWVLDSVYGRSSAQIAEAIGMLLQHASLRLENPTAVESALALFRTRPGLRFSDCLILELARQAGCLPLGTFDRALGRVEGAERLRG
jgi:predicted nucleic-acid-binding protein